MIVPAAHTGRLGIMYRKIWLSRSFRAQAEVACLGYTAIGYLLYCLCITLSWELSFDATPVCLLLAGV